MPDSTPTLPSARLQEITALPDVPIGVYLQGIVDWYGAQAAHGIVIESLAHRISEAVREHQEMRAQIRELEADRTRLEQCRNDVYMLAHRIRRNKGGAETVDKLLGHVLRICEQAGAALSPFRAEPALSGRWVPSSEYTEMQLAHIRAYEPNRWRVDDDSLGYVWELLEPSTLSEAEPS